jgi:hypothetical protein
MRRTKHRRRYHTDRVIANRQRRYRREGSGWLVGGRERHLQDGRLADRYAYFGCGRAHCYLCHFDKLIGDRRAREKRTWLREVEDQLSS